MMVFGDTSNLADGYVVCRIGTELNFPRQSCVFEVFYKTSTVRSKVSRPKPQGIRLTLTKNATPSLHRDAARSWLS